MGKVPADWIGPRGVSWYNYRVAIAEKETHRGGRCVIIRRLPDERYGETYGSLHQRIDASSYRSLRIRLSAAVRAEVKHPGDGAHLWLRVTKQGWGPAALTFYDNLAERPITDSDWREYQIIGDVASDAETIEYGLALVGEGQAEFAAVSIEIVH